ncbi:YhdH/YhfP family quinone oxidoreductase [Acidiluteibacter ferrifornacis]|uniref:Acryloyl-CoA reductase n=1 Tax=Acidiluteibacter ferrifornacis TaxID=2692424 RepID=A0A6N9NG82_9FLAO|nr:YhdH/YhfP family quinone oxidoreductase [Acidiluteibacter ferrifornacis]NBG65638.1 acryloyl-CoA reductase [Acidiluteibacter ferrifornacis]
MKNPFKALVVRENTDGTFSRKIEDKTIEQLPTGEVVIKVLFAGLNYKDGLSASGHKGITRKYPHTPGIDASGIVESSEDNRFKKGDEVIVTSYDLGMNHDGAFAEYIRVPANWVVKKPENLSFEKSQQFGTAGFTAALALHKMIKGGQKPEMGKIVVTGATGGVGSMAVALLAHAGYQVIASTGKSEKEYLTSLGATEIQDRSFTSDDSNRPLLRPKWAGAIDTVGGNTLATLLKACDRNGNVATCGLVASPDLSTTVYPFILNGINLLGVESAECPMNLRTELWKKLGNEWNVNLPEDSATYISLEELNPYLDAILEGKTKGRIIVKF